MYAKDYAELGPLLETFEADLGRIRRAKLTVVLLSFFLAGAFFTAAIFAPTQRPKPNDPFGEILAQVGCSAIGLGSIALGVYMFLRVSREADSQVAVHE